MANFPGKSRAVLSAVIVSALLLAVLYAWQPAQESTAHNTAAPSHTDRFGPGLLTGSTPELGTQGGGLAPPGGLAVNDANGDLIVNTALHDVIDFFLLEHADDQDANRLQQYLKSTLPSPAFDQAMRIVAAYREYMKEHDDLLAVQNLDLSDLNRIADWRTQRDRLRQRILGDQVVQAWYQNDDTQLKQALDELQQRSDMASGTVAQPPQPGASPPRPVPHWRDPDKEQQHIRHQQELLQQASTRYADLHRN